jgi:two-component system response regulator HydG
VNALEHARLLSQADIILPEHLPPAVRNATAQTDPIVYNIPVMGKSDVKTLGETEIETIRHALEQTTGNRTRAAELLGITRRGLIYKLKRLGMK